MESYKYVIIGGGVAGGSAAGAIRQVDRDGRLIVVSREPWRPYHRPPLSKKYLQGKAGRDKVYFRDPLFYRENNIQVLTGVSAVELDAGRRTVSMDDGRVLRYEKLLLATGGYPRRLDIPGGNLAGVWTLRTIDDSDRIREAAGPGKRALVVGGSFISSEVAASLAQLETEVSLVFREPRLLEYIAAPELSEHLHGLYAGRGVTLVAGSNVSRFEGEGRVARAVLDNGQELETDLVVEGLGIDLFTEIARQAGLEMTEQGGVVVDRMLRSSAPDIYAAGDIAAWPDATFERRLRVEHWDVAKNQGRHAGRNMAGEEKEYTTLPYFFSDLFDFSFEAWGDLESWDRTVQRGSLEDGSFAFYYFAGDRLNGVLAVDRPEAEREAMQALVRNRPTYETVGERLRDESLDLRRLV